MIAPMTATAPLRAEHVTILRALDTLEAVAGHGPGAGGPPPAWTALLERTGRLPWSGSARRCWRGSVLAETARHRKRSAVLAWRV